VAILSSCFIRNLTSLSNFSIFFITFLSALLGIIVSYNTSISSKVFVKGSGPDISGVESVDEGGFNVFIDVGGAEGGFVILTGEVVGAIGGLDIIPEELVGAMGGVDIVPGELVGAIGGLVMAADGFGGAIDGCDTVEGGGDGLIG
jgi:hypothetical protein